jgi:hypothetical protein
MLRLLLPVVASAALGWQQHQRLRQWGTQQHLEQLLLVERVLQLLLGCC